ncbi:MAG: lamin tail domain-containing protein [Bacteroidales bacterium]
MSKNLLFLICLLCFHPVLFAQSYSPVFIETFRNYRSENAGGGFFFEDKKLNLDEKADNQGFSNFQTYESERALKLGDKVTDGRLTTPALNFADQQNGATRIKVTFKAQAWLKDTAALHVSIDGDPATLQPVALTRENIADRSLAPYEVYFDHVKQGAKIKFSSSKGSYARFFISEITISELLDTPASHLTLSTNWHQFADRLTTDTPHSAYITVTGVNQTTPIRINPLSSPSHFTIEKHNWNDLTGGQLKITYTPLFAGKHEEMIEVTDQDNFVHPINLRGKSRITTPVALAATDITEQSFRCNWNALTGAEAYLLKAYTLEEAPLQATELFISKYVEGYSNNRAIEIYNGTGKAVNLAEYAIFMENNGMGGIDKNKFTFPNRLLAHGETYLLTDANAKLTELKEAADTIIGYSNAGSILYFTGNDAIGLFKNGQLIDLIGYEDNTEVWGQDKTFYRKANVYAPQQKFYPAEWSEYPKDYVTGAGTHHMDATGPVRRFVAEEILDASQTSFVITGLESDKTYYYTVMAHSGDIKTPYSNLITAKTTTATGMTDRKEHSEITISVIGGQLSVSTATPVSAQIMQINGKTIYRAMLPVGTHRINLPAKGIYIVQTGNQTTKVIY